MTIMTRFWKCVLCFGFYTLTSQVYTAELSVAGPVIDVNFSKFKPTYECPPDSDFQFACPSTKFPTKSLICVHQTWVCDQDEDCPDGEDEENCPDMSTCRSDDQFRCLDDQSLCIPKTWMCDGDVDCEDGSDEHQSNCPHVENLIPCTPNEFQCWGSNKCIPLSSVCDNEHDCDSSADENACSDNNCENKNCAVKCAETIDGAKCYCAENQMWNGTACVDLNECDYDQYCDQPSECTNTEGGFTCGCVSDYTLTNSTMCRADNEPAEDDPTILLGGLWDIRQLSIHGKKLVPGYLYVSQKVSSVDFSHRDKQVYWIQNDGAHGSASLMSAPAHSTSNFNIPKLTAIPINLHLNTVESFALDWVSGNWYFTDATLKRVAVCSRSGSFCTVIAGGEAATTHLVGPRSIVLDPVRGHVYFCDWDINTSSIMKSHLDGSELKPFVDSKLLKPLGLSIDFANQHLYWSDMELNTVERLDLTGKSDSRRIIAIGSRVEYIFGISVFENYLYVSDRHENNLLKIHRYNYSLPVEKLAGNLSRPADVKVYHRQRQPIPTTDPCKDAGCEQICAVSDNDATHQLEANCLCAAGYTLTDGIKCAPNPECATQLCNGTGLCEVGVSRHLEESCTLLLCPERFSYCTSAQQCLPTSWWCNGQTDCPGNEDEGIYCKYDECSPMKFQCQSGKCIDMTYVCDGNKDCGAFDNTDELNCEISCEAENLFACKNDSSHCILQLFVCDGTADCSDQSDEQNCSSRPSACHDASVEFSCRNGQCIAASWMCDGDEDCADGSDEFECGVNITKCHESETACSTVERCIPSSWFCDGEPDCLDLSDESDKNCPDAKYTCTTPNMQCENSGVRVCVKPEQLCDGIAHCDDRTDEDGECDKKMCNNPSSPCSDICHNSPDGYLCGCPPGMKLNNDKHTCILAVLQKDICKQWGICGQDCEVDLKAPHNYSCTCFDGFFLEPDMFTCTPLESDPVYVVFSNRHEIRRVDIMTRNADVITSNAVSLVSGLRNTIALDFYYNKGLAVLFWTDVIEDKIYSATMEGESLVNRKTVIESGLATTEGLAVDWVGKNIYWVESNLDQIEVAKLDGTNRTTLIAGDMVSPRAIVLDPREGALFWTDWDGQDPRIEGCSMSGEFREVKHRILPSEGGGWPNGLTIDYDFKRIYWIDARSESIHTILYNGEDHRLVLRGHQDMSHPFALSLFGNYVYWTDWSTNSLVRANKFNGSDVRVVQKTITQPFDLQVVHPRRQPMNTNVNPCAENNGGCSDICLLNFGGKAGCRCSHRKRLDNDNQTCIDDVKFLLFIKNNEIRGVDMKKAYFNVIPVITLPYVDKPTAIDYDIKSDTLYWADKGLNVIKRANINTGSQVETLIDSGLSNPEGFAIDWLSRNMYFSSYNLQTKTASISVATLNGTFRTELITQNITRTRSIALHPVKGLMFFTDGDSDSHRLFSANMDGSDCHVIISDLNDPTSLSVDPKKHNLYFITMGDKKMRKTNLKGKNMEIINNDNISSPHALTVYNEYLYVSYDDKIVSIKTDGTGYKELRSDTPSVVALLLYDVTLRQGGSDNSCHANRGGCSQLCLPKSVYMSQCKCTAGYQLPVRDNKSCVGITSFLLYAKETEIRGQMFDVDSDIEALAPISKVTNASAVDFHAASDMIYWVDTKANSISRIRRDLQGREEIVRDGINSVEGLAIDWIAGTLYWTDAGHSTIEMAKLDGSNRYVITSGDMEKPRSIVVHPEFGYIYWSDRGEVARIERARLDGSERLHYIYTDIQKPWGMTIDYDTHILYWCDYGKQMIEMVDLMSNTRTVLISSGLQAPVSLTVFGHYIYWLDSGNGGAVYRAMKTNGSDVAMIRSHLGDYLNDIKAFNATRQKGTNVCSDNGGCKELCFHVGNNNVKCACSFGKLANDGKNCTDYDAFIMYSKVTAIESVNLLNENDKNSPKAPITNDTFLRNVIGLSFDYSKEMIFYSDIQRGDIQAVNFNGSNVKVIVSGIGSAEGLAFDTVKYDLYWTSYTNSCISRINVPSALTNVTKKAEVVLQMSKMDHPRAIVINSCDRLMFWTNWNNDKPRIQRSDLNGMNSEDIIVEDILTPNGLTIDHRARKLYWSDARLDKIERCDMDGTNRFVIITQIPQHSFGLAVYDDYLFWTDWMLRAVIRANKYDGTEIVWLRKNLDRQPMGIIAVANDSNDCTLNACHDGQFGCADTCLTNERGQPYCICHHGKLKLDGKTCTASYSCSNEQYEAFTCLNGYCLHFEKSCNGIVDCLDGSDENPRTCANRECPVSMFTCKTRSMGQCIALSKHCDGMPDCQDSSDELDCPCPPRQFRCKTGGCIPKHYHCNGYSDCQDGSDEVGCDAVCKQGFVRCNTSTSRTDCIPSQKLCDGWDDCGDGSDETIDNCPNKTRPTCGPNMFACRSTGECIYENWQCDKDFDCEDKSDETNCTYECKPSQFQCITDRHCITKSWHCDGNSDCTDSSDEKDCQYTNCTDSQFRCTSGRCIDKTWTCDGDPDCHDGSDESVDEGCPPIVCDDDEFECANSRCVDNAFYCDHDDDCGDRSDEPIGICVYESQCTDDQFVCNDSYCIDMTLHCNGKPDCADGSDESHCIYPMPCGNSSMFQCGNGVCILEDLACNGRDDCGDSSDEPNNCYVNECALRPCSHFCDDHKIGFQCRCSKGFKLREDNRTCSDIDECATEFPCSHHCTNTVGSYYCYCAEHFQLESDKRTCNLTNEEGEPYLLVSNRYYIRKVTFKGEQTLLMNNLTHGVAIDFDYAEQMLYWTDIHSQSSTIKRVPINATNNTSQIETLHSSTVLNPDGIAVDWVGRNLYWCDRNTDTVEVSRLNGKYRKILVKDKSFLREPRALEVFPKYGYMFLTDWGDEPHISRISMDGLKRQHIITEEVAWPNALTIDYVTEKIFWADANFDYIAMADLDGKNRHVILSEGLPHTFALTTFMNYIFWTDWETNGVFRAHKFSGEHRIKIATMIHRPMDLVVYHSMRQTKLKPNPCDNKGCSHLCLLRPSKTGSVEAVCECAENHRLSNDSKTCKADCTNYQILCERSSKCIPYWWRCDNHTDCDDATDEPADCRTYYCKQPGLFQCKNATNSSHCIPPIGLCDGIYQCEDKSDEDDCDDYPCLSHQFKCVKDKKCIPDTQKCDGTPQCSDNADEQDCDPVLCLNTQFQCPNSSKCIPYLWRCDGDNDCGDGADESDEDCKNRTCRVDYLKCENTGKCIPKAWECDGEHDCGSNDNSDEKPEKCSNVTCDPTYKKCRNSHCIPGRWWCDNDKDCSDGSDESDCAPTTCNETEIACGDNKCVPLSAKCDGKFDCRDNSDELNCTNAINCSATQFQCRSPAYCIPQSWHCDNDEDCMDGSDEDGCTGTCSSGEFRCNNGSECMSMLWRCDGDIDCKDGSDEDPKECSKYSCPPGKFRCQNDSVCIPAHKTCNGVPDCADGHDEDDIICNVAKCPFRQYRCQDHHKCIAIGQVCDNVEDCADGDDESDENCAADKLSSCGVLNGGCEQNCVYLNSLQRTKCFCNITYKLGKDERSCIETNLCLDWGTCSQKCFHKGSVVHCKCARGYYASPANTCTAHGEPPTLFFSEDNQVYIHTIGKQTHKFKNTSKKIGSMAIANDTVKNQVKLFIVYPDEHLIVSEIITDVVKDVKDGHLATNNGSMRRKRASELVEKQLVTVSDGIIEPQGIAVDWIGQKIYWTDTGTKRIEMCNFNGTRKRTVLKENINEPFGIVVEPNLGKLFWTDRGYPPTIQSANLDGSNHTTLVNDNIFWPNGITIDFPNQRLYWADTKSHTVETTLLDGSDRHIVKTFDASDPPYMVGIFEDSLYVTTYKKHTVIRFPKFYASKDEVKTLMGGSFFIGGIVVFHQYKHTITNETVSNACKSSPCAPTQMCINNPTSVVGYSCVCPDGAKYSPEDKKCNYQKCQKSFCLNNGTCFITTKEEFKCRCPSGFSGQRCQTDVCASYCYNSGTCVRSDQPKDSVACKCANGYHGDRCQVYACTGFCQNFGICSINATSGSPECQCPKSHTGHQCDVLDPNYCKGYCENNGTCNLVRGRRNCTCTTDFTGNRCEQCAQSTTFCANGGTCIKDNDQQYCKCPPGYDPRSSCHLHSCDGFCLNGGKCSMRDMQLYCDCMSGYEGLRCSDVIKECRAGYCQNGGNCTTSNSINKVQCVCPAGYNGGQCENEINRCAGFCKNGGNCTFANGQPYCTCSEFYKGPKCDECLCQPNGECILDTNGNTMCRCTNKLYEGRNCNRSICHDFCYNGAECINCHAIIDQSSSLMGECKECRCRPNTSGPRCHIIRHPQQETSTDILPIAIPVVIAICVLLAVIIFVIIRKKRSDHFRHQRLKDNPEMQVTNPIYMPQPTDDDDDECRQPLDQPYDFDPEKSTNFANPIYEQFYSPHDSRQNLLNKDDDSDEEITDDRQMKPPL